MVPYPMRSTHFLCLHSKSFTMSNRRSLPKNGNLTFPSKFNTNLIQEAIFITSTEMFSYFELSILTQEYMFAYTLTKKLLYVHILSLSKLFTKKGLMNKDSPLFELCLLTIPLVQEWQVSNTSFLKEWIESLPNVLPKTVLISSIIFCLRLV